MAALVIVIVAAVVTGPRLLRRFAAAARSSALQPGFLLPEKKSIAIMPLAAIADDPKLTAFGKGLLEDVAAKLSQLGANHDIEIVSPRAVEDKKVATLADARKEFGANVGLAVSLKQDGDLVRAAYNLIDTGTDKNIAGDSITAPVSDLFTIEDKLTSGVADALHINLRTEERQALGAHATTLPEAYQYYVEGVGYLGHSAERESLTSAEIVFKQALKLDPNYGPAEAGLGETYWYLYDMTKQKRWIESAQQTCAKAIELGNAGAMGHVCLWNHRKRHRTIRKGCRAVPARLCSSIQSTTMHMSSSPRLTRTSTSWKKPRKPTNEESVFARSTGEVTVRWEFFM